MTSNEAAAEQLRAEIERLHKAKRAAEKDAAGSRKQVEWAMGEIKRLSGRVQVLQDYIMKINPTGQWP